MIFPSSPISHIVLWERADLQMFRDMSVRRSLTLCIFRLLLANVLSYHSMYRRLGSSHLWSLLGLKYALLFITQ